MTDFQNADPETRMQMRVISLETKTASLEEKQKRLDELWKQAELSTKKIAGLVLSLSQSQIKFEERILNSEKSLIDLEKNVGQLRIDLSEEKPKPKVNFWDYFKR